MYQQFEVNLVVNFDFWPLFKSWNHRCNSDAMGDRRGNHSLKQSYVDIDEDKLFDQSDVVS